VAQESSLPTAVPSLILSLYASHVNHFFFSPVRRLLPQSFFSNVDSVSLTPSSFFLHEAAEFLSVCVDVDTCSMHYFVLVAFGYCCCTHHEFPADDLGRTLFPLTPISLSSSRFLFSRLSLPQIFPLLHQTFFFTVLP